MNHREALLAAYHRWITHQVGRIRRRGFTERAITEWVASRDALMDRLIGGHTDDDGAHDGDVAAADGTR